VVSKKKSKTAAAVSGTSSGNGGYGGGGGGGSGGGGHGGQPNGNLDSNLKKVFWALAYTPDWGLVDFGCNITQAQVTKDVQKMAQLTYRVRLYGGDCNQTAMVLEAIKQTNADLIIYPGIYITENDDASYIAQRDAVLSAIRTYGTDRIAGVTVGNEFMLNYLTAHNAADPNSTVGDTGADLLIAKINDTRSQLASLKLSKTLPVGNSDAGFYFNMKVLAAVDYGLSNVHAWFANTSIQDAAAWVFQFFNDTNVVAAAQLPNKPKMYVSETGWPTASSSIASAMNGGGTAASVANLQIFIDNFLCKANSMQDFGYFFFEFIDEEWKEYRFGGVEGHWGLLDRNYTLKAGLTLPDCLVSPPSK